MIGCHYQLSQIMKSFSRPGFHAIAPGLFSRPLLLAMIVGVVFGLLANRGLSASSWGNEIVPGQRIGHIYLGLAEKKLRSLMGVPVFNDAAGGRHWTTWSRKSKGKFFGSTTFSQGDGNVWRVKEAMVSDPKFATPEGISTASSFEALWKAYPSLKYVDTEPKGFPDEILASQPVSGYKGMEVYDNPVQGIAFEIVLTSQGEEIKRTVYGILIHQPGEPANPFEVFTNPVGSLQGPVP